MAAHPVLRIVRDEPGKSLELESAAPADALASGAVVGLRFSPTGVALALGPAREPVSIPLSFVQTIRLQARDDDARSCLALTCTLDLARGRSHRERELRFRVLNLDTLLEVKDFAHRVSAVCGLARVTVLGESSNGLDVELGVEEPLTGLSPFRAVPASETAAVPSRPADYHARFREPAPKPAPFEPWNLPPAVADYVRVGLWRPGHRVELWTWRDVTPAEQAALASDWSLKRFFVELFSWKRPWMAPLHVVVDWDTESVSVQSGDGESRVAFEQVDAWSLADRGDKSALVMRGKPTNVVISTIPCERRPDVIASGRVLASLAVELSRAMDVEFGRDPAYAAR